MVVQSKCFCIQLQRLVHQFQVDPSTRVAVLGMKAAGVVSTFGYLTLTQTCNLVYYEFIIIWRMIKFTTEWYYIPDQCA